MDIPLGLIISYSIYSFFLFYQQLYVKKNKNSYKKFDFVITSFSFIGMLFQYGFLIYWGYKVSWIDILILFGISFLIILIWSYLETKMNLSEKYLIICYLGFVILPISAYYMLISIPK